LCDGSYNDGRRNELLNEKRNEEVDTAKNTYAVGGRRERQQLEVLFPVEEGEYD
jgi:hypothetical protein